MPIELKMPALSPTMEEGTLAKWLVKEGDAVSSGDILAEIETDKATMEFEAIDEGVVAKIMVPEGTDAVRVGTVIATIAEEGEDASATSAPAGGEGKSEQSNDRETGSQNDGSRTAPSPVAADADPPAPGEDSPRLSSVRPGDERPDAPPAGGEGSADSRPEDRGTGERVKASPLARRIAEQRGLDLAALAGSGPGGRIVMADVERAEPGKPALAEQPVAPIAPAPAAAPDIPHSSEKLSNMRRTIARRLTESKQTVPHIYLTVDIRLDALLKLRGELNAALEARGIKLSVNDMLIKALAAALIQVPKCNVQFAGDQLLSFIRADISVAVSIPNGLITPIIVGADTKPLSAIAAEMKDLAGRAKEGKLQPHEYQGGTASLSNMGMYGISSFAAVINPPQGMIMAIGAGEKRPWVIDDSLQIATIMSATGSFDHRAIDGADGAALMQAFKALVESPLGMLA